MTIKSRTKVGIAKEGSWGVVGTSWDLLAVNPPTITTTYEQILDQGLRGIAAKDFRSQQGYGQSEVSLEGAFHPEELGHLLHGIMGTVTTSGAGDPYTHQFDLGATPPSYSIEDQPSLQAPGGAVVDVSYQYLGMYANSLELNFSAAEGVLGWSAGLIGQPAAKKSGVTNLGSGTLNAPLLGWEAGTVTMFGVAGYTKLIDARFTFAREVIMQAAASHSQVPSFGYSGELEVTGELTLDLQGTLEPEWYLLRPETSGSIVVTFNRSSGAGQKQLQISVPSASPLEGAPEFDRGGVNVKLGMSFRGIYNSSIGGPARITLINSKPSY